ncbi:MAG: GrpB family protein [Pirellulaceae bacterium]
MPLTSKIRFYDPEWPCRFDEEAARLRSIFGGNLIALHHVGSTAVPGLAAKPEIDILVVVNSLESCDHWTAQLHDLGYMRGKDLSLGHLFYRRNVHGLRTHKIHVCVEGHAQVQAMLRFRDLLIADQHLREQYQTLKFKLERENTNGIGEYLERKEPFILAALKQG